MKSRLRLSLGAWRRLASKVDPEHATSSLRTRLLYYATGTGNSFLAKLQGLSQAEALEKVEVPPPVFLLGFWRSGTTFLHELFCCDTRFGFPSTYACLNPAHFLLTEQWVAGRTCKQPTLRPMDNMHYSWASPQEDEFALLAMGAPSAYEALLVPSLMRDPRPLLDLRCRAREEQDRWQQALQFLIRLLTVQQGKAMVLKSPPHGFRLPMLPALFPRARFVIIERNPYEVFASNLKLWRTLLAMYSLESTSPQEIETFVLSAYRIHEEAIAEGSHHLAARTLARVRYEDLIADPLGEMERLYSELDLTDFEIARPRLAQHIESVANHSRNRFVLSAEQKAAVDEAWGALIREKGYTWSEECLSLMKSA
jgi:hypothetical protein